MKTWIAAAAVLLALLGAVLWMARECKGQEPMLLGGVRMIGC